MIVIHQNDDSIKAIGYTITEERLEFDCSDFRLSCDYQDLVSLDIPEGVKKVWCYNNLLTELNIPKGVEYLNCWANLLTELDIPSSVKELYCDRNVKGLENIHSNCDIIKLF